jgi:hypothetical protein
MRRAMSVAAELVRRRFGPIVVARMAVHSRFSAR